MLCPLSNSQFVPGADRITTSDESSEVGQATQLSQVARGGRPIALIPEPAYSITPSARTSIAFGNLMPSVFAAF
jgi:hypothetical protein